MLRFLAAVALVLGLTAAPALAAPNLPSLTGRVVDEADILPAQVESDLTGKLAALESSTGRQLVVVTVPSLQNTPIEDYGYQLGRAWGIGDAKADNGVLFIVAPNDRKVRVEVGYGLEPVLTDALSSVILQTEVLPRFKAGDMPGGVVAGADALVRQLALPDDQAKAKVAAVKSGSGGRSRGGPIPFFVIMIILFFVFGGLGRRGRRGGGGMGAMLPGLIIGSALSNASRRGGWGDGGGFGGGGFGGGGGGGFSGGGGSFGGGGSSGSW